MVLQPTTLALPVDRRLAVLGARQQSNSVLLRLLSGAERPTTGKVFSTARLSPVIKPGKVFHPRLTELENIRFFARMLNLDTDQLVIAIEGLCRTEGGLGRLPNGGDGDRAKLAEMALLSLMPFDCYLIDGIGGLPEQARSRLFAAAAQRRAGIIFATNQPIMARRYAECAVVIRDGIVHPFSGVAEALAFDE